MKLNVLLGDAYKEGMTADEIISALEKVADPSAEVEKLRNAVTKANGEAAEYKKQLKAKRTDDENAAQEQADKLAEMQKQIEALTADKENLVKEKTLASYREKFVAQGYDAELAGKAASALADGDMDKVFKFQSEFMTAHDTAYKASLLKDINASVVITIGAGTTAYPLTDCTCAQATAESIHTRTRYATRVATSATGTGTFKYLGCFCRSHAGAPASIS